MVSLFKKKKDYQEDEFVEDNSGEYLTIEEDADVSIKRSDVEKDAVVRVFVLENYDNIREILDEIREGKTICLIDIHLIRSKDSDELKRAVNKLKKTVDATSGEIVSFHEGWLLTVPENIGFSKNMKK